MSSTGSDHLFSTVRKVLAAYLVELDVDFQEMNTVRIEIVCINLL